MRMYPIVLLIIGLSPSACDDGPPTDVPSTGTLVVSTSTEGDDPDQDGYLLTVDEVDSLDLDPTGTAEIRLTSGQHTLRVLGVAAHCSVAPDTPLEVDVPSQDTTSVAFEVNCPATAARITVATTGLDADGDGYRVTVDGTDQSVVSATGSVLMLLEPGTRTIALTDLAPNCAHDGPGSRTVIIVDKEVASVEFAVVCTATSGVIGVFVSGRISVGTAFDTKLDGATLFGFEFQSGRPAYWSGVPAGDHVVSLSAPSGCSVETGPQTVNVTAGSLIRDTVEVTFSATCVANLRITAPTTGTIPDERYEVWTCSGRNCFYDYDVHFVGRVRPNGVLLAEHEPGTYHIWMFVPARCVPQFNGFEKQFTLSLGDTVDVELPVACSP
jgi:hypothetical protein